MDRELFIIAGLGNPGREYVNTRHNLGFITVDRIAERWGTIIKRKKFNALTEDCFFAGAKVILIKPQTYMNLSGQSLREAFDFYKISTTNLIVIYDDIDIPTGSLRIRKSGGPGTHNGMRSVVSSLCTDNFPRIRIGTGRSQAETDLTRYVIGEFTKKEVPLLENAVDHAADACETIIKTGIDMAMNKYNIRVSKGDA